MQYGYRSLRIEISRGLVRKYYLRPHHQCPCYAYSLLLSTAHFRRTVSHVFLKPHLLQGMHRLFRASALIHTLKRQRKRYILYRIKLREQIVCLKYKTDMIPAELHKLALAHLLYMLSCDDYLTLRRLIESRKHIKKSRFARTGSAYYRHELAPLHLHAHAVKRRNPLLAQLEYLIYVFT